jgi:MoaA/NifB/PqqE/SkfB family radical SAM enzyme
MSETRDTSRSPEPATPPCAAGEVVSPDAAGQVVVPAEMMRRAGIAPGQDVVIEASADGVRLIADAVRKVHVEITSHCNLDCAMCVRHGWQDPLGSMPVERFERLVDGLPAGAPGGITVVFSGFGEPLVHPAWREMMRAARERGHRVELITNGLLIDAPVAATLVDLGVAQITVSVDGGDEAAYTRMRGVPPAGAIGAVHHLRDARRHTRRPMAIGVAAVATRSTVGSLPALLDWASDLKLDFVSIGNVVPHTEDMAREILWERTGWASVFRATSWRPQLRVGRFDMDESTRALAAAVAERGLTFPSPLADGHGWRNRCRFAHDGMCAVSWDGLVAPCLSLLHSHTEYINSQARRVNAFVVGQVDEATLADIWRRPAFRGFRQRLRDFDFPPCFHCGGCPLTETNDEDCYNNPAPVCGECAWAQGIVLCP